MDEKEILQIISHQRDYFSQGKTYDVAIRKLYLKKLYGAIVKYENRISDALKEDLGKSYTESYMTEIGMTLSELSFMIKNLKKLSKKNKVKTPLAQYKSSSYQIPVPFGNVLVMSPWNYPFLLSMDPLIGALAAGNTVILKCSQYSPSTSRILELIISEVFPRGLCACIYGGHKENEILINSKFDYVFFTGSKNVGKLVYGKCALNLTPCTLELGGKSPVIVDETANIEIAARRIVFGKFLNCGQTCVAPDYVFVHHAVHDKFISEVKKQIVLQYGEFPLTNPDYGKIINQKHFNRLLKLKDDNKISFGGKINLNTMQIEPTVLDNVSFDDLIMQEEIFGPILPVLVYNNINDVKQYINGHETPLALYLFSSDKKNIDEIMEKVPFGGGCVNDVIIHLATEEMPFGGFKDSGLGSYHGDKSFETFTHYKSIVNKSTKVDIKMRYQPYKKSTAKLVKFFLK